MKVILYISHYNVIGGIERWLLNFLNRFPETQILYDQGVCPVGDKIKWNQRYYCDIFLNASVWHKQAFNNIDAKAYIQMIHGDYKAINVYNNFIYKKHPKTTHHICVSKQAKNSLEEVTNYKCDAVFYNFIDDSIKPLTKPENDVLKLVTISRISREKGFERMAELERQLIEKGIDFEWDIFGDTSVRYYSHIKDKFKKAKFKGITKTPYIEISKADYLVQLSDTEANCCVINESMQMLTPVLLTPFPSGYEQIEDGKNGYFIPFDLKDIDFNSIINNIPQPKIFKEKTSVKDWLNFFNFVLDEFYKNNNMVKVRILKPVTNPGVKVGDIIELTEERATAGIDRGLCEVYIEMPPETKELKAPKKTKKAAK